MVHDEPTRERSSRNRDPIHSQGKRRRTSMSFYEVVRAIGNGLPRDDSAGGEITPLAARLKQWAMPGSIRRTAPTLHLVQGTALRPVPVKGLVEPVEVLELGGVRSVRRRLSAAAARRLSALEGDSVSWRPCTRHWDRHVLGVARWWPWWGKPA
jgi:class 3 adenylate cyclase